MFPAATQGRGHGPAGRPFIRARGELDRRFMNEPSAHPWVECVTRGRERLARPPADHALQATLVPAPTSHLATRWGTFGSDETGLIVGHGRAACADERARRARR